MHYSPTAGVWDFTEYISAGSAVDAGGTTPAFAVLEIVDSMASADSVEFYTLPFDGSRVQHVTCYLEAAGTRWHIPGPFSSGTGYRNIAVTSPTSGTTFSVGSTNSSGSSVTLGVNATIRCYLYYTP